MDNQNTFENARSFMKKTLENKGLFVENNSADGGLSISLTQFGLSTVYAWITRDEIDYFIENGLDEYEELA